VAEYFEQEDVTKGYDRATARRMIGCVKPYRNLALATLFVLALSTAGELLVPVMLQKAVDEALIVSWVSVDPTAAEGPAAALGPFRKENEIAGRLFVNASRLSRITGAQRARLEADSDLDVGPWYVFTIAGNEEAAALARAGGGTFMSGNSRGAIRSAALASFSGKDLRTIRAADYRYLAVRVGALVLILMAVLAATFAQTRLTSLIGQLVMVDLRTQVFAATIRRSLGWLGGQPTGRLVTRMTSDVETVNEFFTNVVIGFVKDASVMVGVLATIFFLSPPLALVSTIAILPVAAITAVSRIKARDAFRRQRVAVAKVNSYLSERLSGIQVVQLFAREAESAREFGTLNAELTEANLAEMRVIATFRPLIDFCAWFATACVIVAGAWMLLGLSITLGTLIAFLNLVRMFFGPVQDISDKYTLLQSAMAGGERVFKLLDEDVRIADDGKKRLPVPPRGEIEFQDVWFAYKGEDWVLRGLSFRAQAGETIAIVGYTGAGKTTVINLITRLWDVRKGRILLDGIDIREIPLDELRTTVQSVLQEVFLFSGSIERNIKLGSPISDEEMEDASETAWAHEFVSALEEGYATELAEGAANISAGQRQLVSFARVLARNPAVLILDEATSNVDTQTEHLVQKSLASMVQGRTSIVIAHRLSTIRHADRIIVMGAGRVLETGTHDELLASRGAYWNLYRLQYDTKEAEIGKA